MSIESEEPVSPVDRGHSPTSHAEGVDGDRLEPHAVAGSRSSDSGLVTDADKIVADGLEQPASAGGLTNLDDGLATDAEKIDADGLD